MQANQDFLNFLAQMSNISGNSALIKAIRQGYVATHPIYEGKVADWAKRGLATAALAGSLGGCSEHGLLTRITSPDDDDEVTPTYTMPASSSSQYTQIPVQTNVQPSYPYQYPSSSSVSIPQTTIPHSSTSTNGTANTICDSSTMQMICGDFDQIKKSAGATTAMNVISDVDGIDRRVINQCCDPTDTDLYTDWCASKRAHCADSTRHYYAGKGMGRSYSADQAVKKCNDICDM